MLEDISNQDLILQRSLFTIWTIGFLIHLVQVYYNLDYWTHHSLGSELFQPSGQPLGSGSAIQPILGLHIRTYHS